MTAADISLRILLDEFVADGKSPSLLKFSSAHYDEFHSHMSMFKQAYQLYNVDVDNVSKDAWSHGQLTSKLWLIDELAKLQLNLGRIWILCGWVGTLPMMMFHSTKLLHMAHIRSFDIDSRCAPLADTLNRPQVKQSWLFKASTIDVNKLEYDNFEFSTTKYDGSTQLLVDSADTIINTSCDHMLRNDWWDAISLGKLVVLQNNNFAEITEHVNNVANLAEFKQRYPMSEILYEGVLDCTLYNRYMLIGYK